MTWRPHMPQLPRALPPLLAGVALAAAGCGGDEETRGLSQVKSDRLLALLDNAEQQFEGGDCAELTGTLSDLADEVNEVDSEVDEGVRDALSSEAQELVDLASTDCQVVETTIETAPPTTVFTEPTTTEETEPTTETEPTEEIPTEEPPGEGPDGEGPPGQDEDSESGLKPPKETKEEAAAPGGET
jgi:hypothetical protein